MSYSDKFNSLSLNERSLEEKTNDSIRFIHASDIHLGSHQYENSFRAYDYILALKEILQAALDYSVDFVLLGGDVFNSLDILPGKMALIVEILKIFQKVAKGKVSIIAIEGNHDIRRYSRGVKFNYRDQSWLKVCAKLGLIILLDANIQSSSEHVFQPYDFEQRTGGKVQIKNTVIYGSRYLGEKPISPLSIIRKGIKKERGFYNILLQHFGVEGQMKNVPGLSLDSLNPLHHRVDYLALGHFHKQFILDNWIYNPGSAEAVSSMDFTYNRGIFYVEINNFEPFKKKVQILSLNNRKCLRKSISNSYQFKKKTDFYKYIINTLKTDTELTPISKIISNTKDPFLILTIRGVKPFLYYDIKQREIEKFLGQNLSIGGAKVYQKYDSRAITLENYL
jgi:DNA repair exonuclease SbcCD nuclease subunit